MQLVSVSFNHISLRFLTRTSRLEWREECIVDLLSTVNSQSIDAVCRHQACNPRFPDTQYIRIFSTEIWKGNNIVSFPANLDACSIAVVNETERVVIRFLF